MLPRFKSWLVKHDLIDPVTDQPRQRFTFCTDGPYDMRDFVVKQCFISKITMPLWLRVEVMDVREVVSNLLIAREAAAAHGQQDQKPPNLRPWLNIPLQLQALSLAPFQGRQHSGINDTRNIARIVTELARVGQPLESNVQIDPNRRWHWMGANLGEIDETYI